MGRENYLSSQLKLTIHASKNYLSSQIFLTPYRGFQVPPPPANVGKKKAVSKRGCLTGGWARRRVPRMGDVLIPHVHRAARAYAPLGFVWLYGCWVFLGA